MANGEAVDGVNQEAWVRCVCACDCVKASRWARLPDRRRNLQGACKQLNTTRLTTRPPTLSVTFLAAQPQPGSASQPARRALRARRVVSASGCAASPAPVPVPVPALPPSPNSTQFTPTRFDSTNENGPCTATLAAPHSHCARLILLNGASAHVYANVKRQR